MIMTLNIEVSQQRFKQCIAASWEHRHGEKFDPETIKDFAIEGTVKFDDIVSLTMGSSLSELIKDGSAVMGRTS